MSKRRLTMPKLVGRWMAGSIAIWALALGAAPRVWAMPSESVSVLGSGADREAMVAEILSVLSRPQAQIHLRMAGLRLSDLREQISRLDDTQLREVAHRVDQVKAGGQLGIVIAFLVIAILVVILIYLLDKDIEIKDKD